MMPDAMTWLGEICRPRSAAREYMTAAGTVAMIPPKTFWKKYGSWCRARKVLTSMMSTAVRNAVPTTTGPPPSRPATDPPSRPHPMIEVSVP